MGEWVGPADRNTYVVGNRDTLLRGFWELPADWVPRTIQARLELRYPDGTSEILTDDKLLDAPSYPGALDRAFTFALIADQFPPGIEYHMSLWETEEGYEDQPESTTVIESPIGGLAQIGVQPEPAEMRLVVVPVHYTAGTCSTNTAELTDVQQQKLLDYMHEQNPVQEIFWEFRASAPIEWSTELTSLAQLWQPLQELRISDNAPPNAYYFALVDACAGGIDGAGGIAAGIVPPTKDAAYTRVATGLWIPDNEDFGYQTMVHEVGHLQGRSHIFCEGGGAAGVDPSYPYDNGIINVWGFGIRLFKLHSPTATFDYMTYCGPNWASDWTWTRTFDRIRTLTAWDYEDQAPDAGNKGEVLIGLLMKDGSEKWWTTQGARAPEDFTGEQTIAFEYPGDEPLDMPAMLELLDDGTIMVTAAVPHPALSFAAATRWVDGHAHPITVTPSSIQAGIQPGI